VDVFFTLSLDLLCIAEPDGVFEHLNPAWEASLGYSQEELRAKPFVEFVHPDDWEQTLAALQQIGAGGNISSFENRYLCKDGSYKWLQWNATLYPERQRIYSIAHDITERKQLEERLTFLAQNDHLTGLANRRQFQDHLQHAVARANRADRPVALMFLDLDRFKAINDTYGHHTGDLVLQIVAERLRGCVRQVDIVSRLGGDEFGIILDGSPSAHDVAALAQRILAALASPFHVDSQEISTAPSIGITVYPLDGQNFEQLLKNADTAMYRSKRQGGNSYQFYSAGMQVTATERLALKHDLQQALERKELLLYYQPQLDLHTEQLMGIEAFLRWQHPSLGLVAPPRFLPLAEESGLMPSIGKWVLRTACHQLQDWQAMGLPPQRVAVNLSSRQLRQKDLIETVAGALGESGLAPERLELELTEDSLIGSTPANNVTLAGLTSMGLQLSVDDFGTGYSSLSSLKRFPLNTLKIDQSFVQNLTTSSDDAAIASAIITLAHSLHLRTVAEGVETDAQSTFCVPKAVMPSKAICSPNHCQLRNSVNGCTNER
jgi:diguanylate cyclase (GGDEF)-like protein/PAS domain S-box-containing protein